MYELPPDLNDKLKACSEDAAKSILDCMGLWAWVSNIENTDALEPIASDDPNIRAFVDDMWANTENISFVPQDCRVIGINKLHKSNAGFNRKLKTELNAALDRLQSLGVVSQSTSLASNAGHASEVRYLSPLWMVVDNKLAADKLESQLFELLIQSIKPVQAAPSVEAQPAVTPAADGALRLLQDMRISFNGSSWNAQAGTIIEGWQLCQHLLKTGAPVVPIGQVNIAQCPQCNQQFDVTQTPETETPILVCLQDLRFIFNNVTILRKRGDIEADSFIVRFMLDSRLPVAAAAVHEYGICPNQKCKRVFARAQLLGDATRTYHLQHPAQQLAPVQELAAAAAIATTAITATLNTPPPVPPVETKI